MESRLNNIHMFLEEEDELILDDGTLQSNDSFVDPSLVGAF